VKVTWRHYLMVVVLAFAAYAPTLTVGFIWDDHIIIEHNPWIRTWSAEALKHDFFSDNTQGTGDDYYRPLQAMSHRIDYTLFGMHPFAFHLTDLLFHAATGCALLAFLLSLGLPAVASLLAACLFVVHPGGVEQFLTASGRTTPLSFFFQLICLIYLQRDGAAAAAAGLFAFALALFTKESAVATPGLALLVFMYRRFPPRRYWMIVPMALMTLGYLAMRQQVVQIHGRFPPSVLFLFFVKAFPRILWHYVGMILWPWNLHSHRLISHLSHLWPLYLAAWIATVGWLLRKKNRIGVFCVGWLVITLLPMSVAMMIGGFMIDHWSYPAAPAVLIPLGLLFTAAWEHRSEKYYYGLGMLFFPLLIFWALLTHLNVALRGSDEKIYRWALHFTTSRPIEYNLGVVLLESGRAPEAIPYLENVRAVYPDDATNLYALAKAYWAEGHTPAAIAILRQILAKNPQDIRARDTFRNLVSSSKKHP
jgi:hypothetical protein